MRGTSNTVGTMKTFVTPKDQDVLCGRGLAKFHHPGNQLLRTRIVASLEEYKKIGKKKRKEKSILIRRVVDTIMQEDGRFLKLDSVSKEWYDGGMAAAKYRVGIAFRDASTPKKVKCIEVMKEILGQQQEDGDSTERDVFSLDNGISAVVESFEDKTEGQEPPQPENSISGACSESSSAKRSDFEPLAKFDASLDKLDLMSVLRTVTIKDKYLKRLNVEPCQTRSRMTEAADQEYLLDFATSLLTIWMRN